MNNVERIKYIRQLEEQKANLEQQLNPVCRKIEEEKESCLHVAVNLGYYGICPSTGDKYRCLICGKGAGEEYFYESYPGYVVHAENYLPQYDIKDEQQCNNKFDLIQTLALGLLKENPDMSRRELVYKLNNLIKKSISFKEENNGPKLVKVIDQKK